jgi:hypothetical protein
MKKNKWSPRIFHLIDWQAHESAQSRLTWTQRISTSKLIHGLTNTNHQNKLYYNTTSVCPCCSIEEESLEHVLRCQAPEMETSQWTLLLQLESNLQKLSTPVPVQEAIMHGF